MGRSDGTPSGTVQVTQFGDITGLGVRVGERVYFLRLTFVSFGGGYAELWWIEGDTISPGARPRIDVVAEYEPNMVLMPTDGRIFVSLQAVAGGILLPAELWVSDGTAGGTALLRSFDRIGTEFIADGASLVFRADDGASGAELWRSDGSVLGTFLLEDVRPGPEGSEPTALRRGAGRTYVLADDGVHGAEPWLLDADGMGVTLLRDIAVAGGSRPRSAMIDADGVVPGRRDATPPTSGAPMADLRHRRVTYDGGTVPPSTADRGPPRRQGVRSSRPEPRARQRPA
jgi:ELWxxDGT repeat protein